MATSTNIVLKEFDLLEAITGATLATSSNGALSGSVGNYVLDFGLNDKGSEREKYKGRIGNKTYFYNSNGEESSGKSINKLFIVQATLAITKGTVATKGGSDDSENIGIDVLQPREQFAMAALQGILNNIKDPLLLDNGKINLIADISFKIAQSMINTAADYRAAQSSETPPASVDIDANNITSTTDKILYNMGQSISSINNKLSGGNGVPVNVTNSSLVTHVSNMLTEPVSITGNVSVISS